MRSFKDYRPDASSAQSVGQAADRAPDRTVGASLSSDGKDGFDCCAAGTDADGCAAAELTKKIAAAFNGRPSGEMLAGILAEAERSKREGRLSDAEIDAFYAQFSPLLDSARRRRLKSVVERLKEL